MKRIILPWAAFTIVVLAGCYGNVNGSGDAAVRDTGSDAGVTDRCAGIGCSGHGKCALAGGEPVCACDKGFYADSLECLPLVSDGGVATDAGEGDGAAADASTGDGGADAGPADAWSPDSGVDAGFDSGTDSGPDPCIGHCGNGKQDCGETAADCGGECGPCQPTQILEDKLDTQGAQTDCTSGCAREVTGGAWSTGAGWGTHADGERTIYDFGQPVQCGYVKVEVDGLNPIDQNSPTDKDGTATEFIALHDDPNVSHCDGISMVNLIAGRACVPPAQCDDLLHALKVTGGLVAAPDPNNCLAGCDWFDQVTLGYNWPGNFTFEIRWSVKRVTVWSNQNVMLDDNFPSYPGPCQWNTPPSYDKPKMPDLRYLVIGQSKSSSSWLDGPVYRYVQATAMPCNQTW